MDTRTFLENFRYVAEASDGVARVRELILTLAVQGRLVPQDPQDKPASQLLFDIAAERQQVLGCNSAPVTDATLLPYAIPSN